MKYFMLLLDLYSFLDCWKKRLLEQSPGDFTGTQTRGYQASLDFQSQFYSKEISSRVKKFFNWSRKNGITVDLPYDSIVAAMYLLEFSKQTESSASVVLAYSALKWLHTLFPMNNPLENDLCRNIVESANRSKNKPITKKTPITADIIKQIIDKYATPGSNLKDLRIATICTVGFAGF